MHFDKRIILNTKRSYLKKINKKKSRNEIKNNNKFNICDISFIR